MSRAAAKEMQAITAPKEIKYPENVRVFLLTLLYTAQISNKLFFSGNTNYDMKQEVALNGLIDVKQMFSDRKERNQG